MRQQLILYRPANQRIPPLAPPEIPPPKEPETYAPDVLLKQWVSALERSEHAASEVLHRGLDALAKEVRNIQKAQERVDASMHELQVAMKLTRNDERHRIASLECSRQHDAIRGLQQELAVFRDLLADGVGSAHHRYFSKLSADLMTISRHLEGVAGRMTASGSATSAKDAASLEEMAALVAEFAENAEMYALETMPN